MIIDKDSVKNITPELLNLLISAHMAKESRFRQLRDYYRGRHQILRRKKESDGAANNKIVCNHAKYITDMTQSYLAGNPVTYVASEGYDIEAVKNAYYEQDISNTDSSIVKNMSIYGRAYELLYSDEHSQPRSAVLPVENTFVCYTSDVVHTPFLAVHFYKVMGPDGQCTGAVCNVYDDKQCYHFRTDSDNWQDLKSIGAEAHYFDSVPIIEYINDDDKQGDFEQLISLIDSYNTLMSDRINDKEQFVDAFLFLAGVDIDSEEAKKLKEEKILMGETDAKAQYLSKVLSESDVKVLRNDIKEDIHYNSMVPDLSDENFGNNLSGVAIKYKLLCFEQHVKNKERFFAKSLKKRFKMYNHFLSIKEGVPEVPVHRVDIIFTRNLPSNNLEIAQMISYISNMATQETLLDQLDFITDPKEEAELARKEQAEKQQAAVNAMSGYNSPARTNDEE